VFFYFFFQIKQVKSIAPYISIRAVMYGSGLGGDCGIALTWETV